MWQINRPLAARLQPAARTRSLIQRQNNLAGRAAIPDRSKCFHNDLSQVGSMPAPLRSCALAALGRSILHLPPTEQLGAFQGLISSLSLLPGRDRAPTMALWPMAILLNNLGLPASQALHDFLKDPAHWRGAEDVITVGMAHLNFRKTELLCEIADQIGRQTAPQVLFDILLQLACDPAFSDQTVLLEKLRCELPFCGKGPARLNWLYAAFSAMAARSETVDELGDGAVAELTALAKDQPIAEVIYALTEGHAGAGNDIVSALIAIQLTAVQQLPLSSDRKTAWAALVAAAFNLPCNTYGKLDLLKLIAQDLCKTLSGRECEQTFEQVIVHAASLDPIGCAPVFVGNVVYRAVEGMRAVEDGAQRVAAFECLHDVICGMEPAHFVSSMSSLVQATSEFVPGKLKTLLDLVLSAENGLTYNDREYILGGIDLYKRYKNFNAGRMQELLETWLTAVEALGGHKLGNMLYKFICQLSNYRVTTGMPTIVYRLEAAMLSLDRQAFGRSLALSALVGLCRHLPRQEQISDLLQRVLTAEQTLDNHLNLIGDALNGILPAASASFEKWVVLAVFEAVLKTGASMTVFKKIVRLPKNLTDGDREEIALTVLRNITLVNRREVYPLLSAVLTLFPGTVPADLLQIWRGVLTDAPAESVREVVSLLAFAGRVGAEVEETERDQVIGMLMSDAYALKNCPMHIGPNVSIDAWQPAFWYNAASRISLLKSSEQAGAFRFVLAAVNDARCPTTFDERFLVLRKLWRVAGKLPSHLQGGAVAALKQTLFERRLHSTPQEAAHLRFEAWDDLPHSEVQVATYSPTINAWRALYDEFFS